MGGGRLHDEHLAGGELVLDRAGVGDRVGATLAARLSPSPYHADTSTTRWVAADVNKQMSPAGPSVTVAKLDTVAPAVKFRFDASGRAAAHGHAVTKPAASGLVAVSVSDPRLHAGGGQAALAGDGYVEHGTGSELRRSAGVDQPGRVTGCRAPGTAGATVSGAKVASAVPMPRTASTRGGSGTAYVAGTRRHHPAHRPPNICPD